MEFDFSIHTVLKDEITVIDRNHILIKSALPRNIVNKERHITDKENLFKIINELGRLSARAQQLNVTITSAEQLSSSNQRCYILKQHLDQNPKGAVVGFIKVGHKKLFFVNLDLAQVEVTPLCVLDFYVHESCQRKGCGLKLFNYMLEKENIMPQQLAIDRPSDKMLAFCKRQYGLGTPLKQPNSYVVFKEFFLGYTSKSPKSWPDDHRRGPIVLQAINMKKNGIAVRPKSRGQSTPESVSQPPVVATRNGRSSASSKGSDVEVSQNAVISPTERRIPFPGFRSPGLITPSPVSSQTSSTFSAADNKIRFSPFANRTTKPITPNAGLNLPSILSRPLSTLVTNPVSSNSIMGGSNNNNSSNNNNTNSKTPNSYSSFVTGAPSSKIYTREKSLSFTANVGKSYYIGMSNKDLLAHSRYIHRNKPRPF